MYWLEILCLLGQISGDPGGVVLTPEPSSLVGIAGVAVGGLLMLVYKRYRQP